MKNNFTEETRLLFIDNYMDWEDGMNDVDCLHHILGRVSNSPYNAASLSNFRTHWPEWRSQHKVPPIHCYEVQKKYLLKTKFFLDRAGYLPKDDDLAFLEKYKKYYEN
jgi:hypothetical protein